MDQQSLSSNLQIGKLAPFLNTRIDFNVAKHSLFHQNFMTQRGDEEAFPELNVQLNPSPREIEIQIDSNQDSIIDNTPSHLKSQNDSNKIQIGRTKFFIDKNNPQSPVDRKQSIFWKKKVQEQQMQYSILNRINPNSKWYKEFKVQGIIRKFIEKIRQYSRLYDQDTLTDYHYRIIGDKANYKKGALSEEQHLQRYRRQARNQKQTFVIINNHMSNSQYSIMIIAFLDIFDYLQNCSKKMVQSNSKIPLFSPNTALMTFWHFLHIIFILHNLIQFPLIQVYGTQALFFSCSYSFCISIIELSFFAADILVNFNLQTLHQGEIIKSRKQIIWTYFRSIKSSIMGIILFKSFPMIYSLLYHYQPLQSKVLEKIAPTQLKIKQFHQQ